MDNMKTIVSVLMITYNHEKYIAQAIDSVLMQKINLDYEIVIGEDCSIDKTREIVLEYKSKYPDKIKLLLQEKNVGMMQNFIDTLKACTGKFIALLEGDDYWTDPYKLQKQVNFLESRPDYGLVHTDHDFYMEKKKKIKKNFKKNDKRKIYGEIFNDLLLSNSIGTLTVMFRRNILKVFLDIILSKKHWLMGDYPLWLVISSDHKIGYLSESTAVYRERGNSARQTDNTSFSLKFFDSAQEIRLFFFQKVGASPEIRKQIDINYYRGLLRFSYLLGDKQLGINSFKALNELPNFRMNRLDFLNYYCSKHKIIRTARLKMENYFN